MIYIEGFQDLDDHTFDDAIAGGVVCVYFWATSCSVCILLNPIAERLAKSFQASVKFARLNVDDHEAIAQARDIRFVPLLMIFRNGAPIRRVIGLKSEEDLAHMLTEVLQPTG